MHWVPSEAPFFRQTLMRKNFIFKSAIRTMNAGELSDLYNKISQIEVTEAGKENLVCTHAALTNNSWLIVGVALVGNLGTGWQHVPSHIPHSQEESLCEGEWADPHCVPSQKLLLPPILGCQVPPFRCIRFNNAHSQVKRLECKTLIWSWNQNQKPYWYY